MERLLLIQSLKRFTSCLSLQPKLNSSFQIVHVGMYCNCLITLHFVIHHFFLSLIDRTVFCNFFFLPFSGNCKLSLQEMSLPFLKIAATEIVSGVSGESEEKIRDLFDQAMVSDSQTCIPTTWSCPLYLYLIIMMCLYLSIITLAYCQLNLVMLTIYTDITVH